MPEEVSSWGGAHAVGQLSRNCVALRSSSGATSAVGSTRICSAIVGRRTAPSIRRPDELSALHTNVATTIDLSNTDLVVTIPVLESNPGLAIINEQESNATLERANSILPDKLVKGTVFPGGEDWFKFDLTKSGTIVAQMDMGTRSADLKLYGPDKKEIVSKEVVKSGMIHHTASDVGEYYILVTDGNINNSAYELVLDIV